MLLTVPTVRAKARASERPEPRCRDTESEGVGRHARRLQKLLVEGLAGGSRSGVAIPLKTLRTITATPSVDDAVGWN
jgi:hypothetical protein